MIVREFRAEVVDSQHATARGLAAIREALGLPARPSILPEDAPVAGECEYCGGPVSKGRSACKGTCEANRAGLRLLEAGAPGTRRIPSSSAWEAEAHAAVLRRAAQLLDKGEPWHVVSERLGLTDANRCAAYSHRRNPQ